MKEKQEEFFVPGKDGRTIKIRPPRIEDARRIQVLYSEIYGSNYPMPIIYDRDRLLATIASPDFFWLVGEDNGRIIGSIMYEIDRPQHMGKALGAVVSREYRQLNLANTMMRLLLDKITEADLADIVYAATRTITTAPQHMTLKLGFTPLGIFPNAHRVFESETHTLACHLNPKAWHKRQTPVRILKEVLPFFQLAQKELMKRGLDLGKPEVLSDYGSPAQTKALKKPPIEFEIIQAPHFVQNRYTKLKKNGPFTNIYVPFHEANMLLVSRDQKTEIFVHHEDLDRYAVIMGGRTDVEDVSLLFESISMALTHTNTSYIELLIDAYSPHVQWNAINSRFLPSAYFPAMHLDNGKRWDYIVFSRSFQMLDFRNVTLIPGFRGFLKAYMKIWRDIYVNSAFKRPLK